MHEKSWSAQSIELQKKVTVNNITYYTCLYGLQIVFLFIHVLSNTFFKLEKLVDETACIEWMLSAEMQRTEFPVPAWIYWPSMCNAMCGKR